MSLKSGRGIEFHVLFLVLRRLLPYLHQTLASFQLKYAFLKALLATSGEEEI